MNLCSINLTFNVTNS